MTHDELLKKIDRRIVEAEEEEYKWGHGDSLMGYTLRAVVELHKPKSSHPDGWHEEIHCAQGDDQFRYPCPTIQAIEKGLE